MLRTLRISHPAFFGTKLDETIHFYIDLLGMEILLRQPNLDDASMEHLFFHVGENTFIAYFLTKNDGDGGLRHSTARPGIGGMNHLALDVEPASFHAALTRLRADAVTVRGPVDRGYERSIYFKDPNGVRIELLMWPTPPPPDLSQADIITRAQDIRIARGGRVRRGRKRAAGHRRVDDGSASQRPDLRRQSACCRSKLVNVMRRTALAVLGPGWQS